MWALAVVARVVLMVLGVPVILVQGLLLPVRLELVVVLTTAIAWLVGHSVRQAAPPGHQPSHRQGARGPAAGRARRPRPRKQ